jgi:DNA-binding beta-propeller fold protein YncE
MNMRTNYQRVLSFLMFSILLLVSVVSYALPFNVAPKAGTSLPTTVSSGQTVEAFYTVTNLTLRTLPGNSVKYLPLNVTQVTAGGAYPDLCGSSFDLVSGGSCTLELSVSGAVNAADTDPHHHLFVCTAGVPTCAGTIFPLNVTQTTQPINSIVSIAITPPASTTIGTGATQQYTAVGTYLNGSVLDITGSVTWSSSNPAAATIAAGGLATGIAAGSTNISASLNGINSNSAPLTVEAFAYITPGGSSVEYCLINSVTGNLDNCQVTNGGGIALAINPSHTYAYFSNSGGLNITYCPILSNGALGTCQSSSSSFVEPFGIAFNPTGTMIYVTNYITGTITYCNVSASAPAPTNCITTGAISYDLRGVTVNSAGTILYTAGPFNDQVYYCTLNAGAIGTCTVTGSGFSQASGLALNPAGTIAYVTNYNASTISYCTINQTTGAFTTCAAAGGSGFSLPMGIAVNSTDTIAYVASYTGALKYCAIGSSGSFTSCTTNNPSISSVTGVAIP